MRIRTALHVLTAIAVALGIWVGTSTSTRANENARALDANVVVPRSAPPTAPTPSVPATASSTTWPPATTTPAVTPAPTVPSVTAAPSEPAPPPAPTPTTAGPTTAAMTSTPGALVARVTAPQLLVYDQPGASRATINLPATTEFGNPRVLLVTQQGGDWLRVLLPTRPNGAEGWIRVRDVALATVNDRVTIDLATRTLVWTRNGAEQLRVTVAVGAFASPTPTGRFFVTDLLPQDPASAYGAWVIALNGRSDAFTVFEGGDPRIAIHGTNDPSSIGGATSSGCVRVEARPLATMANVLPLGTPVLIS